MNFSERELWLLSLAIHRECIKSLKQKKVDVIYEFEAIEKKLGIGVTSEKL